MSSWMFGLPPTGGATTASVCATLSQELQLYGFQLEFTRLQAGVSTHMQVTRR